MSLSLREKAHKFDQNFIIALDGPSASGKGHIGKIIAEKFSLKYFQSSLVYRGLAKLCISKNVDINNLSDIIKLSAYPEIITYAKDNDLSDEDIGNVASKISIIPEVRLNLSKHLTKIIESTSRLIMEGRDIGTVIAVGADLKIFITASIEQRAKRRYKQLRDMGKECMIPKILEQLKERDERDETRASAPLIPAKDALIIDTSELSPMQVFEVINNFIQTK